MTFLLLVVFCGGFDEGERIQIVLKSGPLSALQRNAIYVAFCWRTDDGQTLTNGLVDSL